MIFIERNTTNKIVISNDNYSASTFHFEITNDLTNNRVEFDCNANFQNERYVQFNITHTSDLSQQDLANCVVYIEDNLNTIKITQNNKEYIDVLFVKSENIDEFIINNDDEKEFIIFNK